MDGFGIFILIVVIAFIMEFIDISFGMGYGMITPILLLLGFSPLEIIPVILLNGFVFGILAGFLHKSQIDISFKSISFKVIFNLVAFGIIGIVAGSILAIRIPENILRLVIGFMITVTGGIILFKKLRPNWLEFLTFGTLNLAPKISWLKLIPLSILASFNKGLTGGGFGPIVTAGQILSGIPPKVTVTNTVLAESIISLIGFFALTLLNGSVWISGELLLPTIIGGLVSIPLAVYYVHRTSDINAKNLIAIGSILLGIATIVYGLVN